MSAYVAKLFFMKLYEIASVKHWCRMYLLLLEIILNTGVGIYAFLIYEKI